MYLFNLSLIILLGIPYARALNEDSNRGSEKNSGRLMKKRNSVNVNSFHSHLRNKKWITVFLRPEDRTNQRCPIPDLVWDILSRIMKSWKPPFCGIRIFPDRCLPLTRNVNSERISFILTQENFFSTVGDCVDHPEEFERTKRSSHKSSLTYDY